MRKFFYVMISIIILCSLFACSKKTDPMDLNNLYSVDANIKLDNFKCSLTLTRLGNGMWDATFSSPENLNGLTAEYKNEDVNIGYKELSFSLPKEDLPATTVFVNITKALDNVAYNKDIKYTENKNIVTAEGQIDENKFKLYIDKKSKNLLSFEIPDINLKTDFSNYSIKQ